ncbi:hypothetical protein CN492_25095, partial [Priestia megaterium]
TTASLVFKGTNLLKYGPWALGVSCIKIITAVVISLAMSYIVGFGFIRKNKISIVFLEKRGLLK